MSKPSIHKIVLLVTCMVAAVCPLVTADGSAPNANTNADTDVSSHANQGPNPGPRQAWQIDPASFAKALGLDLHEPHPFVTFPGMFTEAECQQIIGMATGNGTNGNSNLQRAGVTDKANFAPGRVSSTYRVTDLTGWEWVSSRIYQVCVWIIPEHT